MLIDVERELAWMNAQGTCSVKGFLRGDVHKGVYLCAAGGFPIIRTEEAKRKWSWVGKSCDHKTEMYEIIGKEIRQGLGLSGMLTYMNTSNYSYEELGDLCSKKDHDWGWNWMTLSFLFVGLDPAVEMALTRDTRFWTSWPVETKHNGSPKSTGKLFMVHGSVKSWSKYVKVKDSNDFDPHTRNAMYQVHRILKVLVRIDE